MATFGESACVRGDESQSSSGEARPGGDSLQTATKLSKITQEFKTGRVAVSPAPQGAPTEAPFIATDFVAEAYREACERLEKRVLAHLPGGRLELAITDNRHTMISVKRDAGTLRARVHHMFLEAPPVITRALARYISNQSAEASRELGAFIDEHQGDIAPRRAPRVRQLETRGRFHDLQEIFHALNLRYFHGKIDARVTWGEKGASRRRRRVSMKMGSYSVEEKLIRIHPSLDRDFVPRFFVEWIMFHEMLHQVHAIPVVAGRRQFHTPEFLAHERTFHDFQRAREWERRNLDRLLTY